MAKRLSKKEQQLRIAFAMIRELVKADVEVIQALKMTAALLEAKDAKS